MNKTAIRGPGGDGHDTGRRGRSTDEPATIQVRGTSTIWYTPREPARQDGRE